MFSSTPVSCLSFSQEVSVSVSVCLCFALCLFLRSLCVCILNSGCNSVVALSFSLFFSHSLSLPSSFLGSNLQRWRQADRQRQNLSPSKALLSLCLHTFLHPLLSPGEIPLVLLCVCVFVCVCAQVCASVCVSVSPAGPIMICLGGIGTNTYFMSWR